MSGWVAGAYLVGAVAGLLAHRSARLEVVWPHLVRMQILLAAVLLSVVAAWRLSAPSDLLWPGLVAAVAGITLAVSYVITAPPRRAGLAALRAWTASANTSYFCIPVGGALAGAAGVNVAVLVDRLGQPVWSLLLWMLRRDAPRPQHARTSWVDQAPLLALALGLALKGFGHAPDWTENISLVSAPVLAGSGAALFVGSVLHPTQRIAPRPGLVRWARLIVVRVVLSLPLALLAPSAAVRVVVVLSALSIPTFGPPQMSTVYGYADASVAAASRYGWLVGAAGLLVALVVTG